MAFSIVRDGRDAISTAESRRRRRPEPPRYIEVKRPGELVALDCFYIGRLSGTEGGL